MLMLAFWTSAVLCWIVGFERRSRLLLLLACFLAGLAALSKYFGIAIVPLLLVHGLVKARRVGLWVGFLALPIAMLLGFDALTRDLYGAGHFLDAAKYAAGFEESAHSWGRRFVVAAAFAGGGAATVLICAPLLWSRRIWISGAALCAALILLSPHLLPVLGVPLGTSSSGAPWWLHSQLWLFVFGGISLVALCLTELRDRRDPESILLVAWTLGTFIFAGVCF